MKRYIDLIQQTFEFPTREFGVDQSNNLLFNNVPLMDVIKRYGTPLRITYLPKIGEHIEHSKVLFKNAMKNTITRVVILIVIVPNPHISSLFWKPP